ncbi:uncharacterized protein [Linepithema humile]|uniref:uncharacterized protein n=1 Tax=Linepithema humile TaxID=83485 RepID=UPI00062380B0|nr:PREDICTED: uncharacterized protein LOC105679648 [Linepithema humile]
MALYTSTYRYYDMILFLLGYLYFCVAINPAESLDLEPSFETERYSQSDMENCTHCLIRSHLDCSCQTYNDECLICCPGFSCCFCSDCTSCWHNQQKTISLYQINIYILCGYGIIGLIVIYYKICKKIKEGIVRTSMRRTLLQRDSGTSTNRSTSETVQERPPSYNEVCSAPSLYTSPYNMTSMEEAPPQYPGTPKLQERSRDSNESPATFSITQHI